ncbi:hypothetical protein HAU32_04035 [Weissella confusa]|uniref:Uncharacterized protein n=1 Tax=Weissella fermenti TaxID=2987699 RepID=A0ABT6D406_9LACO|nr:MULTISPECIES: hypothetical protein [Weissella]MBJ7688151.1 hypothetical protein [Weissella confusa]MCW0926194.1 hypothetical protein [Weissella sp. LMG 11983]MDF9300254.1 hypothetical protein [Weissella sp. BK2]
MKKIKTLSSISLVTTLLGLGMPLLNPISTINANEMGEMQMGAPIDLDVPTPNVEDFNNENATAKTNNTMSIQAWPTPTYNSTDHSWHFLNGEGSVYGSASAAFKRAISTKENFTIEADSFITSDSQWKYSTDTIGIVLSTASSDKLAESQTDGQKSKAGYANPDVAWQTMIGSQPFVDWTDNWLLKKSSHREFIRRTIKGAQRQLDGKDFGQDPSTAGPLDSTYSVTYDAGTRELTYKTKRGAQATDTLPDGINELYVGFLSDIQGSGEHDVTRMQLKNVSILC